MTKRITLFIAVLTSFLAAAAQTAEDSVYVFLNDQPDGGYFLPAPPDTCSADFTDDMLQWQWGKTQRSTPRGQQASRESQWTKHVMRYVMAQALQLDTISPEATPAICHLVDKTYNTTNLSTKHPKEKYMRIRPFARMNEHLWAAYEWYDEAFYRGNGSYPSGHTAFGFGTALVMAEMWPELQDTILRRGFQFGENRIITGAHWQSDVSAGYLCAAASVARLHNSEHFRKDLLAARAEYARLKGLPKKYSVPADLPLPDARRFLNPPVDTTHYRYLGDVQRYWNAKQRAGSERLQQAIADADKSMNYVTAMYNKALGIEITLEGTPAIYSMLKTVRDSCRHASWKIKSQYFRTRPFVRFGEQTAVPEDEASHRYDSSFVSNHTNIGWGLALALAEMAPECQNEVLRIGYEYGYSRLILCYHWASDIDAARLVASAVMAHLHATPDFYQLMDKARREYRKMRNEK